MSVTARRDAGLAPRVALVRSRYDPSGGAERFVQGALAALKSQGASLTIVTRSWPDHDGSAIVLDPFHVGSLWRDTSFARAVCAELARRRFDLVQSHERIACCDVYRAGDGVHAEWLAQRARGQTPLRAWAEHDGYGLNAGGLLTLRSGHGRSAVEYNLLFGMMRLRYAVAGVVIGF